MSVTASLHLLHIIPNIVLKGISIGISIAHNLRSYRMCEDVEWLMLHFNKEKNESHQHYLYANDNFFYSKMSSVHKEKRKSNRKIDTPNRKIAYGDAVDCLIEAIETIWNQKRTPIIPRISDRMIKNENYSYKKASNIIPPEGIEFKNLTSFIEFVCDHDSRIEMKKISHHSRELFFPLWTLTDPSAYGLLDPDEIDDYTIQTIARTIDEIFRWRKEMGHYGFGYARYNLIEKITQQRVSRQFQDITQTSVRIVMKELSEWNILKIKDEELIDGAHPVFFKAQDYIERRQFAYGD